MALAYPTSCDLFLFGTLRDADLLSLVAGCPAADLAAVPAQADGWTALRARQGDYPVLVERAGAVAKGLLLPNVSELVLDRLRFFEAVFGYRLHDIKLRSGAGDVPARVFLQDESDQPGDAPWDLGRWQREDQPLMLEIAAEIMALFCRQTAMNTPINMAAIEERAESRLRARAQRKAVRVGHRFEDSDVEVTDMDRPYARFFSVEEYLVSHRTFQGGWSRPLSRTALISADAVTVLPYDPVLDKVVLVEQFRIGPLARGDGHPWLLEVVAGRCDSGQTPEEVARREAEEEAGLVLGRMDLISQYYPSPGAFNEYIYSYIGQADLAGYQESVHGLGDEDEDIATHLLAVDELLPLVTSGEANNSPLIISILWLALNRERLQKEWTGA